MKICYDTGIFLQNSNVAQIAGYIVKIMQSIFYQDTVFFEYYGNSNSDETQKIREIIGEKAELNVIKPKSLFSKFMPNPKPNYNVFHSFRHPLPSNINAKTVATIADFTPFIHPEEFPVKEIKGIQTAMRKSIERADIVLVFSNFCKNTLAKYFPKCEKKIRVANLGIDEKQFFPEGNRLELEDFRESLRLPKKYFLMISDLQPHKNIENFLTAYRELFRDYREKTPAFVLVGKKGLNSESITKKLQDTPFSYYFENVNNLNYLINNATALISTSLYEENNVLPLIACACSVPILLPSSPLSKEIFTEDTALFADVNDTEDIYKKLKHLLEDISIDTYLSNKGYELARKFTWKNTAMQIYEIYRELL